MMDSQVQVSIIMGSSSDLKIMSAAASILESLSISHEVTIVSAHRTPDRLVEYSKNAHSRGIKVIIAGAGGAAHLPGMVAAFSPLPVIGVPIKSSNSLDGWDSILSILQMPPGVPVATMALNQAQNAGLLAARIIGSSHPKTRDKIVKFMNDQKQKVESDIDAMAQKGYKKLL